MDIVVWIQIKLQITQVNNDFDTANFIAVSDRFFMMNRNP